MTTSELMDFLLQRQHTVERSDSVEMRDSSRLGAHWHCLIYVSGCVKQYIFWKVKKKVRDTRGKLMLC